LNLVFQALFKPLNIFCQGGFFGGGVVVGRGKSGFLEKKIQPIEIFIVLPEGITVV